MPTNKPFLTYEQQLDLLEIEKGLIIADRQFAEDALKRYGYYALISGYKDLFRNRTVHKYKHGTSFEEIVALHGFDMKLRELFMKYLLQIEQKMRSLLSYYFTEQYGHNQSEYLMLSNYDITISNKRDVINLIDILYWTANRSKDYEYIKYQRRKYGNVPLWVLVKALTFGNISKMYRFYPQSLRHKISCDFSRANDRELSQYLSVLTKFRNACAHNERLFSYFVKDDIPDTMLHSKLGIPKKGAQYTCGKRDLFSVVIAFRYLLPQADFYAFKAQLVRILENFLKSTTHILRDDLLREMGFPSNWTKISTYRI